MVDAHPRVTAARDTLSVLALKVPQHISLRSTVMLRMRYILTGAITKTESDLGSVRD